MTIKTADYNYVQNEICEKNRVTILGAVFLLLIFDLVLLTTTFFVEAQVKHRPIFLFFLIYTIVVLLLVTKAPKENRKTTMAATYLTIAGLMLYGVFLSYNSPEQNTVSFVGMLLVIALLFVDKPSRIALSIAIGTVLCLIVVYAHKAAWVRVSDTVNIVSFSLLSIFGSWLNANIRVRGFLVDRRLKVLLEEKKQLDFILYMAGGGIVITKDDTDKTFLYASESLTKMFGYTVEEFMEVSGGKSSGIILAKDFGVFSVDIPDDGLELRFRVRCKDGNSKWVTARSKIIINERGERELHSVVLEISQLMETQKKLTETSDTLRQERQLYRDALLHDCDYAYIVNVSENRFYDVYKGGFLEEYFFDSTRPYDEVMARVVEKMRPVILYGDEEFHLTSHYIAAYEQGKQVVEIEYYAPDADVYKKKSILLSKNEDGIMYAFVVAHDITKSRKAFLETQAALVQLAEDAKKMGDGDLDVSFNANAPGQVGILADVLRQTTLKLKQHTEELQEETIQDPMTGVKNKKAWQEAGRRLDEQILTGTAKFAVVVCDLNGLKTVNDTIGHEAGDTLIIRASRHICKIFSHSPVYRIGGDEFTVILEGDDLSDCERLLREFDLGMAEQTENSPAEPPFSIALGISHYQPEDTCFAEVVGRADIAMYKKKTAMKTK